MKYILIAATAIFLTLATGARAQEILPSQLSYFQEELFINPAYAGSQDQLSASFGLRKQWVGIDGSPMSQRLQVHNPFFNNKVGLGLNFENQTDMVRHQMKFNGVYAYRIPLKEGTLSLGLQAGFTTRKDDYTGLSITAPDQTFAENSGTLWGFNFGTGAYYSTDKYYLGISLPNFIDNSLKQGEDGKLENKLSAEQFSYYFTGGYLFAVSPSITLKPAALLNYSKNTNFRYNMSATAFWKEQYWIGAFMRSEHEAGAIIGLNVLQHLTIGYAISFNYGEDYNPRGATHQVTLGFIWNKDKTKTKMKLF